MELEAFVWRGGGRLKRKEVSGKTGPRTWEKLSFKSQYHSAKYKRISSESCKKLVQNMGCYVNV